MTAAAHIQTALANIRPRGTGCHSSLLSCANSLTRAGLKPGETFTAIRARAPTDTVHDTEIHDAVAKAVRDCAGYKATRGSYQSPVRHPVAKAFDAAAFMAARLAEAEVIGEADIWEASPIRIDWAPKQDAIELVTRLWDPGDMLFIGGMYDAQVKPAADWLSDLREGKPIPPHIIPNPMTGMEALNKAGKLSFRCDASVKSFRFAVAEFDNLSCEDQLRFWWSVNLPICALIDSGNKSLHALIKIDGIFSAAEWTEQVENQLFGQYLTPLGCDANCRNEARLSRMPGYFRVEKQRWQRILYLCPEGRRIKI